MQPFRTGLFGDLHIHPYSRFASVSERGLNSWVECGLNALERIYDNCASRGIFTVWCLGDLFHVGSRLYTEVYNAVYNFFREKKRAGFDTTLIAGNHDLVARGEADNAMIGLQSVVSRVVWQRPEKLPVLPNVEVLFVPYTERYKELKGDIVNFTVDSRATRKLIVGHLAVEGAVVGVNEFKPPEGCAPSLFRHSQTLLGHYHKRQSVTETVHYIGSAMSLDFHDSGEEKGFEVLEIDPETTAMRRTFVPIPSVGFLVVEKMQLRPDLAVKDRIVRVDYTGDLDEEQCRKTLLSGGAKAVVFNCKTVRETEERVLSPDTDLEGCIREYVARRGEGFDKDRLIKLGLDIVGVSGD